MKLVSWLFSLPASMYKPGNRPRYLRINIQQKDKEGARGRERNPCFKPNPYFKTQNM
jgi:hypothetical protein